MHLRMSPFQFCGTPLGLPMAVPIPLLQTTSWVPACDWSKDRQGTSRAPVKSSPDGEGNGNPLQYSCLKNPWTEESGRLKSMGLHDWACVHEGGGRWVGSNKLVELKRKKKRKFPRDLLMQPLWVGEVRGPVQLHRPGTFIVCRISWVLTLWTLLSKKAYL